MARAASSNRPKQVAPDPDMRAKRAPALSSAESASPIAGASALRRQSPRSLRVRLEPFDDGGRPTAGRAGAGKPGLSRDAKRPEHLRRRHRHAGIDQHQMQCGEVGEQCRSCRRCPWRSAAARQGTSAGRRRDRGRASRGRRRKPPASKSRSSARSVAAASLDPPPMPEATGRFFSSSIETGGHG